MSDTDATASHSFARGDPFTALYVCLSNLVVNPDKWKCVELQFLRALGKYKLIII